MKLARKWFFTENVAFSLLIIALILLVGSIFSYLLTCKNEEGLGSLTGGVVVCVISVANTILLYLTLKSQNQSNRNLKEIARQEQFETTLFNLLDKYIDQIDRIRFETVMLKNPPSEDCTTINGSSFIDFAFEQLSYLKAFFEKDHYIGYYDSTSDLEGYNYKTSTKEESDYDMYLRTKYMANVYGISKEQFDIFKSQIDDGEKSTLQICYHLFYCRWGIAYDHCLRIIRAIIEHVKSREIEDSSVDYMSIVKTYVTSKEQLFLTYHASIDKEFADALQNIIVLRNI